MYTINCISLDAAAIPDEENAMSLAAPAVAVANQSKPVGHTAPLLPTPPTVTSVLGAAGIVPTVPVSHSLPLSLPPSPTTTTTTMSLLNFPPNHSFSSFFLCILLTLCLHFVAGDSPDPTTGCCCCIPHLPDGHGGPSAAPSHWEC